MLEDRARGDLADPLALQPEAGDETVQGGREHVLVRRLRVGAVGPRERDAVPADDRDPANSTRGHTFLLNTGLFLRYHPNLLMSKITTE
ncbi:hypothetical protein GCM10023148_17750 [Actinokineospora soli]